MSISQNITAFPPAPQAGTDTPEEFSSKADSFVAHQSGAYVPEVNTWAGQANSTAASINTDATNAGNSASAAAGSASSASTSAGNAATSESNAATSETNANNSANAAATSESNAATSESNAAASASNASTSETNASDSADEAAASATSATSAANYKGIWNSGTAYLVGESVSRNDTYYYCNVDNTGLDPALNPAEWQVGGASTTLAGLSDVNLVGLAADNILYYDELAGRWKPKAEEVIPDYTMAIGNINNPLLDLPLNNSLAMKQGVGSVTFTRNSTATYVDRYGVVKTAAIDEPRFEKDGLLIEGQSTNLLLQSTDMNVSPWSNPTGQTMVHNFGVAPDGTTTSTQIQFTNDAQEFRNTLSLASDTYTFIVWVKGTVGKEFGLTISGDATLSEGKTITKEGWNRYSISTTTTVTRVTINSYSAGSNFDTIEIWGGQLEALPYMSSYIPTTTTAVTRTASLTTATAYDNIPNLNEDWSMSFDLTINGTNTDTTIGYFLSCININDINETLGFRLTSNDSQLRTIVRDSVGYKDIYTNVSVGQSYRVVATFVRETNTLAMFIDGVLVVTRNDIAELSSASSTLKMSGISSNSTSTTGTPFISLKNVKHYDRTLTPTEVGLL